MVVDSVDTNRPYYAPPTSPHLLIALRQAYHSFQKAITNKRYRPDASKSLSTGEKQCLRTLRSKTDQLIMLPSDKGGEFCVVKKQDYVSAVTVLLSDRSTYRPLARYNVKTTEKFLNDLWRNVCSRRGLPVYVCRRFISTCARVPPLYALVKTHKSADSLLVRPIINTRGSPNYNLCWLLNHIITPLVKFASFTICDSDALITQLRDLDCDRILEYSYPASLDVVNMFTSIPVDDSIQCIIQMADHHNLQTYGLLNEDLALLLKAALNSNYFTFEGVHYKQMKGLPMGSVISGTIATLFMNSIEQLLSPHLDATLYCRYVDDVFLLTKSADKAVEILSHFNNAHPSLRFELEHPVNVNDNNSQRSINLLDLNVAVDGHLGSVAVNFYQKKARSDVFVNYKTSLPTNQIKSIVMNERKRIINRSSDPVHKQHAIYKFNEKLTVNGYPATYLTGSSPVPPPASRTNRRRPDTTVVHYFRAPFICDGLDSNLRRIFSRMGLNVRIVHPSRTLRHVLNQRTITQVCNITGCTTPPHLCYKRMVVYRFICNICPSPPSPSTSLPPSSSSSSTSPLTSYIGATKRALHERVSEHLKQSGSAIYKHDQAVHSGLHDWRITTLAHAKDQVELAIKEDLLIRQFQPNLNTRDELASLRFHHF